MERSEARAGRVHAVVVALLVVVGALIAVAHAPDIPAATLVAKYAPPPSKFVALDSGARVHYREDQGPKESPALVLLHGSNSSSLRASGSRGYRACPMRFAS